VADRRLQSSLAKLLRHAEASARLDAPRAHHNRPATEATAEERREMGQWFLEALQAWGAKAKAEGRSPVIHMPVVRRRACRRH
jgi:hypothetical protein